MNASGRTSWKVWISLLCAGFSLFGFLFAQTPDLEREQRLLLAQSCFESERWEEAEKHFLSCTQNQFARAQIHDLMEENARIRPRHVKGAIRVSRIIPGMAYLYTGDHGKAIANFALIGGIAVGAVVFWPVAVPFGVLYTIDWAVQGSNHAEQVIREGTEGKRRRILERIVVLAGEE